MKSAHRSVMFYIGQKELVMQRKLSMVAGQYRQKCEAMQEKFMEQFQKMQSQCQKWAKKCEMLEQENENLSKDKQELQEKYSEKSRSCVHTLLIPFPEAYSSSIGDSCIVILSIVLQTEEKVR